MFSTNLGPMALVLGGTEIGLLQGGAKLSFKQTTAVTKADVTGENARDKYVTGEELKITGAITEATLEQLAAIAGGTVSGTTTKQLLCKTRVGENLRDSAAVLVLKPLVGETVSTTEADWITIPVATISPQFEPVASTTEQRLWAFEAEGHPVRAADIASGGHLYNGGSPEYAVGDLIKFGDATS